jgi:hypothetical protein
MRFSAAHLLAALAAMFVVLLSVDELPFGKLVESIIFSTASKIALLATDL